LKQQGAPPAEERSRGQPTADRPGRERGTSGISGSGQVAG